MVIHEIVFIFGIGQIGFFWMDEDGWCESEFQHFIHNILQHGL